MELAPMSFLGWLIIGALAGWLAGKIVVGYGYGFVGNIVIGILGACVGGLILPKLGIVPESTGANFIAATLGAVILLFVLGLLRQR
ncbi:GlsB/YeaQ/YmgE family stress response membrane protein [Hyphomicrobium sp. 1Nfss2.1]